MADTIGSLNIKIGVGTADAEAGFKHLTGEVKLFTRTVEAVKPAGLRDTVADLKHAASAADRARSSVGGLVDRLKGLAGGVLKGGVAGVAAGLTAGLGAMGAGGVEELLGGSIDLAAKAEANALAFEVMTGSAERARDVMGEIRQYAKESPFGVEGVTAATRGLIAYGLANEKAVPTVRMLGDVASASGDRAGETLDRLVLAYGQVYTSGRLMGTELKQFTEAGVPLIDELAKVLGKPKAEIKGLVEAGQVGFAQVARAFRNMTSAGGRFAGMSERYADSFQGTVDRLKDGADDLKREFGKALIEDLGLKGLADDGERFAGEMKKVVADLRPGIRLIGDLGKGVAQVLKEGIRNAPLFGQALFSALRKGGPQLAGYADRAVELLRDLRDFKADPAQVVEFAADIGLLLARGADLFIDRLKKGLAGIYQGEVKSIVDALLSAAVTWQQIKGSLDAALDAADNARQAVRLADLRAKGQLPTREAFVADRMKADGLDEVIEKLKKQADRRWTVREAADPTLRAEVTDRQHFLKRYIETAEQARAQMHAQQYTVEFGESAQDRRAAADAVGRLRAAMFRSLRDDAGKTYQALGGRGGLQVGGVDLLQADPAVRPGGVEQSAQELRDEIIRPFLDRIRAERNASKSPRGPFGLDFTRVGSNVARLAANARKAADSLKVLADVDVPAAAVKEAVVPQLPPLIEWGTAEFARLAGQALMPPFETESVEVKIDRTNTLLSDLVGIGQTQIGAMGAVVNMSR